MIIQMIPIISCSLFVHQGHNIYLGFLGMLMGTRLDDQLICDYKVLRHNHTLDSTAYYPSYLTHGTR